MRIHTDEIPYQCSHCNNTFSLNRKFIIHMRIHIGEKVYQCSQCDKGFSQNSNLITHTRIHTEEKTYQCSQCNKTFLWNSNLICHIRHTLGWNLINSVIVAKLSNIIVILQNIWEHTLGRNHINAAIVTNALAILFFHCNQSIWLIKKLQLYKLYTKICPI